MAYCWVRIMGQDGKWLVPSAEKIKPTPDDVADLRRDVKQAFVNKLKEVDAGDLVVYAPEDGERKTQLRPSAPVPADSTDEKPIIIEAPSGPIVQSGSEPASGDTENKGQDLKSQVLKTYLDEERDLSHSGQHPERLRFLRSQIERLTRTSTRRGTEAFVFVRQWQSSDTAVRVEFNGTLADLLAVLCTMYECPQVRLYKFTGPMDIVYKARCRVDTDEALAAYMSASLPKLPLYVHFKDDKENEDVVLQTVGAKSKGHSTLKKRRRLRQ